MAKKTVRATYRNGKLEPLDPIDLKDGETITVTIYEETEEDAARRAEVVRRSRGAWKGLIDPDEFLAHVRERRLINTRPEPKL